VEAEVGSGDVAMSLVGPELVESRARIVITCDRPRLYYKLPRGKDDGDVFVVFLKIAPRRIDGYKRTN